MNKKVLKKLQEEELSIMCEFDKICRKNKLQYFLIGGTLLGAVRHKGYIPWDDDIDVVMPREDFNCFIDNSFKELNSNLYLDYYTTNDDYCIPFAKIRIKNTVFTNKSDFNEEKNNGIWIDIFPMDRIKSKNLAHIQKKVMSFFHAISMVKCNDNNFDKRKKYALKLISFFFSNNFLKKAQIKSMVLQSNRKDCNYFANFGSQYKISKQLHPISDFYPAKELMFENQSFFAPADYNDVLKRIYGENYMELPPIEKRITHNPKFIKFSDGEEVDFNEKI